MFLFSIGFYDEPTGAGGVIQPYNSIHVKTFVWPPSRSGRVDCSLTEESVIFRESEENP